MAKGNLFLGQARGKVGSVVFARAFGQQITRTRPTSVANPKSHAQNTQRAILATIAKEAALLTPIVDHSFANVQYGAPSVRYFRKLNMGILRNRLLSGTTNMNLSAKGANAVPNALKISEGSLPAFSSSYQSGVASFYQNGAMQDIAEVTVGNFHAAYPYLQGGDQLTLVKFVKSAGTLNDGDASFALKVDRIVFAPNAFDDAGSIIISDEGMFEPVKLDLSKTTDPKMLVAISGGGGNGLSVHTDRDNTYAVALILSRKVNNVWQRSTQYLEMTNYDDWTDIATAIESYGATSSLADATEYLNQAEEGTEPSGYLGSYLSVAVYKNEALDGSFEVNAGETGDHSIEMSAMDILGVEAIGYAGGDKRVVTVEILDADNKVLAHGNGGKVVEWHDAIQSSMDVGVYKALVLYQDGSRSTFNLTVTFKS